MNNITELSIETLAIDLLEQQDYKYVHSSPLVNWKIFKDKTSIIQF